MSVFHTQFKDDKENFDKRKKTAAVSADTETREEISRKWMNVNATKAKEEALPKIAGWRRAAKEDSNAIEQLQTFTGDVANSLYQRKSIHELIDKCYFSVVQFDSNDALVSFTAFDSYPNIPSTPFWNDWLNTNYRINGISPGNVLFIHYMVWQPQQENKFLPLLLETSFAEFLLLKYIIIIKPPKADVPEFYGHHFFPLLPFGLEQLENRSIQLLLLCLRSSVIQPLCVRTAFKHDLDVIMSLIESRLKSAKGADDCIWDVVNFFFAEDRKTLICEFERQMVGVMVLHLQIDLDVLNEGFELAPFNGLRKQDPTQEEDEDPGFRPIADRNTPSTNILMSSKLLLSRTNWEMSFSKFGQKHSTLISSENQFSQLSFIKLSAASGDLSGILSHNKSEIIPKMEDIHVLIRTSESTMTHFYPPPYHGRSNAFLVDFFAVDCNKLDEKQCSFDFLEAAFKVVPDKEYCILLTPTDSLSSPLLDLFVRVTPRYMGSFNQELYLCHKNSLSVVSMAVRLARKADLLDISNFLKYVDEGDKVYQDIISTCFGKSQDFKSFVLTFEKSIVGVSLVNSRDSVEHFHMYFEVADFEGCVPYEVSNHSVIEHLVISPLYYNHARFFVRDIMRLEDVTCLYYVSPTSWKKHCNLLTVLGEFVPLKPRRKVGFRKFSPLSEDEMNNIKPSGLHFLSSRLCGFRKIHMNIVIVVVGASQTAFSFFENLIFGPESSFYKYNNLICVSSHGIDEEDTEEEVQNLMFPVENNFSAKYVSSLALEAHVTFVHGVMTEINRSEKYIVVNNKSKVRYDYLVLTCGLQYLLPTPEAHTASKSTKQCMGRCRNKSSLTRFLCGNSEEKPSCVSRNYNNMFIINTRTDAQNALHYIQYLMEKTKKDGKKIIVYGHDLHVFLTINTLLKLGIPGEFIAFVEPFPSNTSTVTLFNDCSVDQAVVEEVKGCKVSYYTEYFLYDWSVSSEDYITSIRFHSKRKQIVIPCLAFIPFLEKLASDVTFNACSSAGLVYDGRLVINHNFRTNDNYIYAAGSFTKYARRYFATKSNHRYYNSREVGQRLSEIIKKKIDPMTKEEEVEQGGENCELVPRLVAPVFFHCHLPGDFNLFILRKPGRELDLETAYNLYNYGEVLTTGDCKMKNGYGYFRLHLNPEGFVESITCYTKDKIDYVNLSCLYGMHERILNNLLFRYDLSMIPDFFEYFRQPWALALFHDNFQHVREYNYRAFFQEVVPNKTFYEKVVEELEKNDWKSLDDHVRLRLEADYLHSRIQDDIKNNLLRFLEHYGDELPVYGTYEVAKTFLSQHPRT